MNPKPYLRNLLGEVTHTVLNCHQKGRKGRDSGSGRKEGGKKRERMERSEERKRGKGR